MDGSSRIVSHDNVYDELGEALLQKQHIGPSCWGYSEVL